MEESLDSDIMQGEELDNISATCTNLVEGAMMPPDLRRAEFTRAGSFPPRARNSRVGTMSIWESDWLSCRTICPFAPCSFRYSSGSVWASVDRSPLRLLQAILPLRR